MAVYYDGGWGRGIVKRAARYLILRMTKTTPYKWLLLDIFPYIRFTCYYTSFRGWKYVRGYRLLQPGDIILTNDRWKLTSLLVPGEWTHAALCVDKGSEFEVAEMTHTNFTESTFFDLCKESTRVAILRCRDWNREYVSRVVAECLSYKNVLYDVCFENDFAALYCSELIVASDVAHRLQASNEDVLGLGMPYVSPGGIWKAKNIDVIWDSDKEIKQ